MFVTNYRPVAPVAMEQVGDGDATLVTRRTIAERRGRPGLYDWNKPFGQSHVEEPVDAYSSASSPSSSPQASRGSFSSDVRIYERRDSETRGLRPAMADPFEDRFEGFGDHTPQPLATPSASAPAPQNAPIADRVVVRLGANARAQQLVTNEASLAWLIQHLPHKLREIIDYLVRTIRGQR